MRRLLSGGLAGGPALERGTLDGQLGGVPCLVAALHVGDVEALALEECGGSCGAGAGEAGDDDGPVGDRSVGDRFVGVGQLGEALAEVDVGNVGRAGGVALGVLGGASHVEQEGFARGGAPGGFGRVDLGDALRFDAGVGVVEFGGIEHADDAVEADADEALDGGRYVGVLRDQDDGAVGVDVGGGDGGVVAVEGCVEGAFEVALAEVVPESGIEQDGGLALVLECFGERESRRRGHGAEDGRAFEVELLHAGEVGGRLGLAGEEFGDEGVGVGDGSEGGVVSAFVADGGLGDAPEVFAAGAAGAVTRPDLEEVGQFEEGGCGAVELASGGFHGAGLADGGFEQVGPAEVADEDEVSGEQAHGLGGVIV